LKSTLTSTTASPSAYQRHWPYHRFWAYGFLGVLWLGLGLSISYFVGTRFLPVQHWQLAGELPEAVMTLAETTLQTWQEQVGSRGDLALLHERLKDLPWVKSVDLRRFWPNNVLVYLMTHQAKARWGGDRVLTETGELIGVPVHVLPRGLPKLAGPDDQAQWLSHFYDEAVVLLQSHGHQIDSIKLTYQERLEIRLDNEIAIILRKDTAKSSLAQCLNAWDSALTNQSTRLLCLDCRYAQGLAVSLRDK